MFDYMFKGIMIEGDADTESEEFKFRLFDVLSDSYFTSDPYFTIGLGIGMGTRSIQSYQIRYTLLNINSTGRYAFLAGDYMRGAAYAIITIILGNNGNLDTLFSMLRQIRMNAADAVLGIAILLEGEDANIQELVTLLEEREHATCVIERDCQDFHGNLLLNVTRYEPCIFLLPVQSLDELGPGRPHVNRSGRFEPASQVFVNLLHESGFRFFSNQSIIIEKSGWAFKIDLQNASVWIAYSYCMGCRNVKKCGVGFKKLCIVKSGSSGFSSKQLGLRASDLYYLSLIYAIQFNKLPPDVVNQFPGRSACYMFRLA